VPNRRVLRIAAGERLAVVALRTYPDIAAVENFVAGFLPGGSRALVISKISPLTFPHRGVS
jgi:hypothetical protein